MKMGQRRERREKAKSNKTKTKKKKNETLDKDEWRKQGQSEMREIKIFRAMQTRTWKKNQLQNKTWPLHVRWEQAK